METRVVLWRQGQQNKRNIGGVYIGGTSKVLVLNVCNKLCIYACKGALCTRA